MPPARAPFSTKPPLKLPTCRSGAALAPYPQKGLIMETTLFEGHCENSDRIIYTPSAFAKSSLIHLQEIGQLYATQLHTSRRENLASYLFFLVKKGSGILEYDGVSFRIKEGDCVFIDCRKRYSHSTSKDLWTLKWVHFYGPNMNSIYEKYAERGGSPCFSPGNYEVFDALLDSIHEIAASDIYIRDMKIYEKLTSLLTLLMEESWNPSAAAPSPSLKRDMQVVKDYLDLHYQEKITLDHLAEIFYINKFYLTRIFREQFGLTINNYLLQIRITHAKRLLRFTDLSIEKIAVECGMSDANYFARMFRKVEGSSPGEFRKRW